MEWTVILSKCINQYRHRTILYYIDRHKKDIEKYGLFSYEEFNEIFAVPHEVFDAFNGQYLKIAIGKGLTNYDNLYNLIKNYIKFFK